MVKNSVSSMLFCDIARILLPNVRPRLVSELTPTTNPTTAQAIATPTAPLAPAIKARVIPASVMPVAFRR